MIRKLFTPRKQRNSIRRPSSPRLCLEQLEKREMLDAALTQGFNFLTLNAYQTAQQSIQAQATAQNDLARFQSDAKAYTAGQGVTLSQINQDLATLQQDANNIQALSATFQKDVQFFITGLMANSGNLSASDSNSLLVDALFLQNGQATFNSSLQTATTVSSQPMPNPPPPPTTSTGSGTGTQTTPSTSSSQLTTLTLNPLNVNLLGLNVQTSQIQINITATSGNGDLLGNVLTDTSSLLNLPAVSAVVNNVLGNVVTLLNSGSLSVAGVDGSTGPLSSPGSTTPATTPVLTLHVAPVTLNLLGATVTTSPIDLTITAQSGQGLVLGNVVTDLANLFNPPLPSSLSLSYINGKLDDLLNTLNQQLPNVGTAPPPVTLAPGQFLALEVSPINLNLLGLLLQTSPIQINATNYTGNGDLLGNVVTTLLNTVEPNPQNQTADLTKFNNDLNAILGKVIGVLNAATLAIPSTAINSLSNVLQQLTSPTLVNSSGTSQTVPVLNLTIASPDGSTPPVAVNLLGLQITTSNIQAQLEAQTGDGQILGNLVYNLANLLNPGGAASLLPILGALGL